MSTQKEQLLEAKWTETMHARTWREWEKELMTRTPHKNVHVQET